MHKINSSSINTKLLLKSSFWYVLSHFLGKAMVFISTPIFVRLLSKQEYGDFSVFASWQSVLLIICGLDVYVTLNRARFDYKTDFEFNKYITSSLFLSTFITIVFIILYFLFSEVFDNLFLLNKKYLYLMFAYILFYPALGMFITKQRLEYKYKLNALLSFSLIIASFIFSLLLVHLLDSDRLYGRIAGQYGPYIITGIVMYAYFLKLCSSISLSACKYAFFMALPLAFSYLGSQIFLSSDKVIVQHLCSSEDVAILSLAATSSHIMLIFVQTLNLAWAPWFYDKLNNNEFKQINKMFKFYLWFVIACTLLMLLIGPEILNLLGGMKYKESLYILPVNMLCGIFNVLSTQFVNIETYYKKTYYSAILTACVAIGNIVLCIVGVNFFGYQAVCYVTALCQVILIYLHFIATKKMNISKMLTLKNTTITVLVSALMIPGSLLLYQYNVQGWKFFCFIMAAAVGVLFIKRKSVRDFLRSK